VTNLTFTKGILTEVKYDKQGGLIALLSLPVGLAKATVAIPARLIQFKIDTTKKQADLLTAEKSLLTAKEDLDKKVAKQQTAIS
jgi:hypothetical protein